MKVAERSVASRTDGVAELKRQLDVADADIALVKKRLDESQGRLFLHGHLVRELKLTPYNMCASCRWCRFCGGPSGRACSSQGAGQKE